jgi:predicted ATPase/class 3 adenylate cyclase/DNA-binding CsgD family transcriptional regulator
MFHRTDRSATSGYGISLMFAASFPEMLASMTETDPRADMPPVNWSELGVGELPTGTVTLLLADVEGSTRLWETQPDEMTAAVARLDRTLADLLAAHGGVRPVEQGEGDSFVVAFSRASEAAACALELQRAPLAPIRLRIGLHTGEVQLRDEGNYIGPTINRTARLRDLAHGGQTVLSGTTEDLVVDTLPPDAWLTDLGSHELRGVARPERVAQLCHPDIRNDFPPLRASNPVATEHLPVQLTSFIGRRAEIDDVRQILAADRLVTLTGAGGVGKTRLAIQVASQVAGDFDDGVWYVDLAPIADPSLVPVAMAGALGVPDQPGRSTTETLIRFVEGRRMLVVLDNCEHLLDAVAELTVALLSACPGLRLLATSREPIGVGGEVIWRVPSLSVDDEAVDLFADRARRARSDFAMTDDDLHAVREICRRLDGMPLAIELAAARVRALSLEEIAGSLHDRFRLLTGGRRMAVRRQQTLHASVDWSHTLLTEAERVLFRRLAAFMGGFDLAAARAVAGGSEVERYQVLDQLTLLVDKSLVLADGTGGRMRYRLLETMRQYALEKLGESGEADTVRTRHRDHYTSMATLLDAPGQGGREARIAQAETEIDNLRAAFAWSHENSHIELALQLVSSLQPLWLGRGRIQEGLAWFDAVLSDDTAHGIEVAAGVRARALADKAALATQVVAVDLDQAEEALAIAREIGDAALVARALTACGGIAVFNTEVAARYLTEASELARGLGDRGMLSEILGFQAYAAFIAGDPIAARAAGEEGLDLADAIGDRPAAFRCRWSLGLARWIQGELAVAVAQLREAAADAETNHDVVGRAAMLFCQGQALAYQGDTTAARAAAAAAIEAAADIGGFLEGFTYAALAVASLAAGDVAAAADASEVASQRMSAELGVVNVNPIAQIALARGDLIAARRWADDAVSMMRGWHLAAALTTRARVAIARGEPELAERDAHDALACAARVEAHLGIPDALECLGALACAADSHREAARLFGAADALRQCMGAVRFKIYDAEHHAAVATLRNALGDADFESAWAEGAELSTDKAIAYAQRGRGERKRPSTGWASLTPTELDVVRLVSEGLGNKDIATRLFISPRTVETHLTHVYTKLGLASRVQLAQEAARHS